MTNGPKQEVGLKMKSTHIMRLVTGAALAAILAGSNTAAAQDVPDVPRP